jgi:glycosyltransferase involved in cell wall biosynthesis
LSLVYILGEFPALTQTFVLREIRELGRQGLPPQVYYLSRARRGDEGSRCDTDLAAAARLVPGPLSLRTWTAGLARVFGSARGRRALRDAAALRSRGLARRLRVLVNLLRAATVADAIHGAGATLVHAHFATSQTEVALALSRLTGIPFSFTAHARDIYADASALPQKLAAAAFVVTCTAANRAHLARLAPEAAAHVHHVPHGVTASPAAGPREGGPPRVLAVGRLVPKKGFATFVDALGRLTAAREAVVVGDGPERARLVAQARRHGVAVTFTGALSPEAVALEMARADILVAPSVVAPGGDRDGIPNVVLEAMAAGLPVVATTTSGLPEAVEDGVTGLLVPASDPDALAAALGRLLADPGLRRRLGEAGRQRVAQRFDLAANVARLRALFAPWMAAAGGGR